MVLSILCGILLVFPKNFRARLKTHQGDMEMGNIHYKI